MKRLQPLVRLVGVKNRVSVFAMALALLLAQTLGLLHGVVHNPASALGGVPSAHGHAHEHADHSDHSDHGHGDAPGFLVALFSDHHDDADCRAYDQLSHADALPGVASVVLPVVLSPTPLAVVSGLATARWHALFQARGPPSPL